MFKAPRELFSSDKGKTDAGDGEVTLSRRARARLVRAVLSTEDRSQDHAAGRRRRAGARLPSDPRRNQSRRLPAGRERGRDPRAHGAGHQQRLKDWGTSQPTACRPSSPSTCRSRRWSSRRSRPCCANSGRMENWAGLIMEVTEDEIIHDLKIANDVADALRAYNCSLALDDFGRRRFLAGAPAAAPLQRAQDRPQLRDQLPYRSDQCRPVRNHRGARQALRAQDRRRRRRDDARKLTSRRASVATSGRAIRSLS